MTESVREYSAVTRGIHVRVTAFYLEEQSVPDSNRYVWAYRVAIENHGRETVQLLRRTWEITDATGRTFRVEGEGAVGEQPVLEPGEAFEYTSGTPLETPSGFMVGWYHMTVHGTGPAVAQAGTGGKMFDVAIPAFSLDSPTSPAGCTKQPVAGAPANPKWQRRLAASAAGKSIHLERNA